MKKYISTLIAIVAVSSLWQTNAPGAVEMDDSELATLYGGVIWGIDCDCIVGAGACPSEVGAILGCAGCGSSAEDCTGACSTTSNYICGNPKWQIIGWPCTLKTVACTNSLSTYTGWCTMGGCLLQGGTQPAAPACSTCTRTDC